MGGRLHKSAINTALLLQNEVESNKSYKLKTSTLFLDIKGAFDHVSKNRLLQIMISLLLPTSLILWVSLFLDDRVLRLAFNNSIKAFKSILTSIPQGSPILPILFLIYIRDLFKSANIKFRSYLDNISLTTTSKSLKKNIKTLEREVKDIVDLGKKNTISFNIDKTELIHFDNSKNKPNLKLPNGELVSPSKVVKWLGIYFDENLRFKEHIAYRASKAKQAFYRVQRLTNISRGLSPFAIRQLYLACVTSVIDYGSILWWKTESKAQIRPLQAIQNLALRKTLGVFKTAPIIPIEVELALVPPIIRLNHSRRRYAFRILKLSLKHPIRLAFEKSFQRSRDLEVIESDIDSIYSLNTDLKRDRMAKMSQIEIIVNSIRDLIDPKDLETIRHFYFAPWDKEIPYKITILRQPKEETAILHNLYLKTLCNNSSILSIYIDGSQIEKGLGIGLGLAVYSHETPYIPVVAKHRESRNIGASAIVYNRELEGVTRAIKYASSIVKRGELFNIFTDNQAGLLRLKAPSNKPGQNNRLELY